MKTMKSKKLFAVLLSLILAFSLLAVAPLTASAKTITVSSDVDFTAAAAAFDPGDTVKLTADIDFDYDIELDVALILDLNGHTLTLTNGIIEVLDGGSLTVINGGALVFEDADAYLWVYGGSTAVINADVTMAGNTYFGAGDNGSLTLTGNLTTGLIEAYDDGEGPGSVTITGDVTATGSNSYIEAKSGSTLTITGNVTAGGEIFIDGASTLTITGNVTAGGNIEIYGASTVTITGDVTLTGDDSCVSCNEDSTLTINGSLAVPNHDDADYYAVFCGDAGSEIFITGDVNASRNGVSFFNTGGEVTIGGQLLIGAGMTYVTLFQTQLSIDDYEAVTTKAGYRTYTDGERTLWVNDTVIIRVPLVKTVEQGGAAAPGEETFEFEVFDTLNELSNPLNILNGSIDTDGTGDFDGLFTFGVTMADVGILSEGFYLREVNGGKTGWAYSDAIWFVNFYRGQQFELVVQVYEVIDGEINNDVPQEAAAFTNVYTAYTIIVQTDGNGTASANVTSAAAGTQITLTAAANAGYAFKEWQVVSGGVSIAGSAFTMPANDVTVKAIFEEAGSPPTGDSDITGWVLLCGLSLLALAAVTLSRKKHTA